MSEEQFSQQEMDSAEVNAAVYIVDGMPMTLHEMAAYNEAKEKREAEAIEKADAAHLEMLAQDEAEYLANRKQNEHADSMNTDSV